jgi:hypothetical protein
MTGVFLRKVSHERYRSIRMDRFSAERGDHGGVLFSGEEPPLKKLLHPRDYR